MTGETGKEESGWTVDTLKVLHDSQIEAGRELTQTKFQHAAELRKADQEALALLGIANQRAQDKFEESVTARFVQVNEFRGSLDDLGKQMATRRELESTQAASDERFSQMLQALGDLRSRLDVGPLSLPALQTRADEQQGARINTDALYTRLIAVAAVAGVIGHYIH